MSWDLSRKLGENFLFPLPPGAMQSSKQQEGYPQISQIYAERNSGLPFLICGNLRNPWIISPSLNLENSANPV
jgi:hypothetical protein